MSDKRVAMRERARRFRRRMSGKDRAVSPVVATLILILIAVAAAAALYLWLVVWQGHITSGIGNVGAQPTLSIGGSTSVYPFDQLAVTQFEQNYSDITVSDEQGGSTAGMLAVCAGDVNIGAASFPVTAATLVSTYGCSASVESTITVTTVAYDAVDVIVQSGNPHGLQSVAYDTLALIYADATAQATGKSLASSAYLATTYNNGTSLTGTGIPVNAAGLTWANLPAEVPTVSNPAVWYSGAATPAETAVVEAADTYTALGAGGALPAGDEACAVSTSTTTAPSAGSFVDICDSTATQLGGAGPASGTPCGFFICAGGSGPGTSKTASDYGSLVQTYARSDASGTTQSFEARILDAIVKGSTIIPATQNQLTTPTSGFTGCGSNNLISDCGYTATSTASGNPGVISGVAGDANAIGYASDGLARASGSGVGIIPFTGVDQLEVAPSSTFGGILPTTGATGTIAHGIQAGLVTSDASEYYAGYLGWRPFDLVTLAQPTGVAAEFLNFVTNPGVNPSLATEAQEVGIFSIGVV